MVTLIGRTSSRSLNAHLQAADHVLAGGDGGERRQELADDELLRLGRGFRANRLQASTSSKPPAKAQPSTAAISGLSNGRWVSLPNPRPGIDAISPAANRLRSMPEQNVPHAPAPRPAQCTSARNRPRSTATSTAALTSASSVTSAAANRAASPISAATAAPPLLGRSTIVTDAPISASRRAVAPPRPEAPPVTRAEIPLIRMRAPRERYKPSDLLMIDFMTSLVPP
jgi:hypothetical protein